MRIEKIKSIKKIENLDSYELNVKDNHNFFVNGFLKHNCKASKYDGKLYWFTQSMDLIEENSAEVEALKINGLSFKNGSMAHIKETMNIISVSLMNRC